MNTYFCYQLWHFIESDVVELKFENDKEAFDYWLRLYEEHKLDACFSITRLFEVDGVFHEDFIAMIKCCKNGVQVVKSHAL
mgnify:FL=1